MKTILFYFLWVNLVIFTSAAMAADKVVVIPLSSSAKSDGKLWSTERVGTGLLTHTDSNGYCTTNEGINYALSIHMETWGNAAEICPAGTWVCSDSDLPQTGSCPIEPLSTYQHRDCAGNLSPASSAQQTALFGFVSDAAANNPLYGKIRYSTDLIPASGIICAQRRAWCCWK